jgi:hypothetical protein
MTKRTMKIKSPVSEQERTEARAKAFFDMETHMNRIVDLVEIVSILVDQGKHSLADRIIYQLEERTTEFRDNYNAVDFGNIVY